MSTKQSLYPQARDMENIGNSPPYTPFPHDAVAPPPPPPTVGNVVTISPGIAHLQLPNNPSVGPESTELICPQCRCRVLTKVRHRSTAKTHIACLLLSWTCCCCCLPYCMDSCRNANHFCPMCGAFIGTYQS